jgi:ABC-type sugar transport system substrate-binding protein
MHMQLGNARLAAFSALAILLSACSGAATQAPAASAAPTTPAPASAAAATPTPAQVTIGALWLDEQGFYAGVKKGIETNSASQNLKLLGNNSKGDPALEAQFMQTLIDTNVKAIIMSAVSEDSSLALIKQAHEKGIPVICYNTCIKQADADQYVYAWVTGDHKQQGGQVGKAMGKYFVSKNIAAPKIAIVSCERYEACKQRNAGFTEELKKLVPGAVIVDNQEGLTIDDATRVATDILTKNPDLNGIYGEAESMAVGATKAIEAAGKVGHVFVFGHDMALDTAQLLAKGDVLLMVDAIPAQDVGKLAVEQALKAIGGTAKGATIVPVTPIDYTAADKATVDAWLAEHADGIP